MEAEFARESAAPRKRSALLTRPPENISRAQTQTSFSWCLAHAEEDINRQLVQSLIRQRLARQLNPIETQVLHSLPILGAVFPNRFAGTVAYLREQRLDLVVLIKLPRLLFQDQIVSHAPGRKLPNTVFIFTAIRMRIEMTRAVVSSLQ